jgi:thiamine kinase-like enzyme
MRKRAIQDGDLPQIRDILQTVFQDPSYEKVERLGGLTNRTYHVTRPDHREYIVRIPGEGTQDMIDRTQEKASSELACRQGIDTDLLYFDGATGRKVTRCIPEAVTMNRDMMKREENAGMAAAVFRRLHDCREDTHVPFEVFDMAASYERIIEQKQVALYDDYDAVKQQVIAIKRRTDQENVIEKVPCHNDPLCENWVFSESEKKMYLVDWEYAGMNDPFWDLADLSIEAEFDAEQDRLFLEKYLGRKPTLAQQRHFLACKVYVDYLWTLWALTRVPYDGEPMQQWADERYQRLKSNLQAYDGLRQGGGSC